MSSEVAHGRERFGTERLNALTDGVFAIVLTLLVLELKLPEAGVGESVLAVLADNAHVFAAWLISFAAIGRFWVAHHAITAQLRGCHTGTVALNFVVLGAVSLMPFAADTIGSGQLSDPWSTVVFAGNVALASLSLGLLARHASREPSLHREGARTRALARGGRHHLFVLPGVAVAAAALAFTHPLVAVGLLAAEFVVVTAAVLLPRAARRVAERHAEIGPNNAGERSPRPSTAPGAVG